MSQTDLQLSSSSTPDVPGVVRTFKPATLPRIQALVSAFHLETQDKFQRDSPFSSFPHFLFHYAFEEDISAQFQLLYDASEQSQLIYRPPEYLRAEYDKLVRYRAAVRSVFNSGQNFVVAAPNFVLEACDFDIFVGTYDSDVLALCADAYGRLRIERAKAQSLLLHSACKSALPAIYSMEPFEFATYTRPLIDVQVSATGVFTLVCEQSVPGEALAILLKALRGDYEIEMQSPMLDSADGRIIGITRTAGELLIRATG